MKHLLLAGLLLALPAQADQAESAPGYFTPDEAQAVFQQANEAYYREQYPQALEGYLHLVQRGHGGPDLLYNLGTAHLAAGQLGEAVLQLERARKQGARGEDLEAQLALARSRQLDQVVGGGEDSFLLRVALASAGGGAAWALLCCWWMGTGLGVLFLLLPRARRTWVGVAAGLCLALTLPSGFLVAAQIYVQDTLHEAVILSGTLPAREIPQDNAKVAFEVHAGLKVRVLEQSGRFVRIQLPNGLVGWAQREGLQEI